MQQLGRREDGPQPLQRRPHLVDAPQPVAHGLGADAVAAAGGQRGEHLALDEAAGRRCDGGSGAGRPATMRWLSAGRSRRWERPKGTTRSSFSGRSRSATALAMTSAMRASPLTLAANARLGGAEADAGHEVGQHDLLHAGLAQRRQHPLDVAQEQAVGPDDQDALVLQREPVRVEQVGGAVEGDDGLAGARATLHHEHAGLRRADDLVLLALDGGHDVAEAAGAALLEGGDQRGVAAEAGPVAVALLDVGADAEVALAEQLVFDVEELAALHGEVATPGQSHRVAARGPVERLGHRCPPVDHDRLPLGVGHGQPPEVERLHALGAARVADLGAALLGQPVDAAEDEHGVVEVELGEAAVEGLLEHVALVAVLVGAAPARLGEVPEPPGVLAAALEAGVREVDVRLLVDEIGVLGHPVGLDSSPVWGTNTVTGQVRAAVGATGYAAPTQPAGGRPQGRRRKVR